MLHSNSDMSDKEVQDHNFESTLNESLSYILIQLNTIEQVDPFISEFQNISSLLMNLASVMA